MEAVDHLVGPAPEAIARTPVDPLGVAGRGVVQAVDQKCRQVRFADRLGGGRHAIAKQQEGLTFLQTFDLP